MYQTSTTRFNQNGVAFVSVCLCGACETLPRQYETNEPGNEQDLCLDSNDEEWVVKWKSIVTGPVPVAKANMEKKDESKRRKKQVLILTWKIITMSLVMSRQRIYKHIVCVCVCGTHTKHVCVYGTCVCTHV